MEKKHTTSSKAGVYRFRFSFEKSALHGVSGVASELSLWVLKTVFFFL
jgi:hypothetical protein